MQGLKENARKCKKMQEMQEMQEMQKMQEKAWEVAGMQGLQENARKARKARNARNADMGGRWDALYINISSRSLGYKGMQRKQDIGGRWDVLYINISSRSFFNGFLTLKAYNSASNGRILMFHISYELLSQRICCSSCNLVIFLTFLSIPAKCCWDTRVP